MRGFLRIKGKPRLRQLFKSKIFHIRSIMWTRMTYFCNYYAIAIAVYLTHIFINLIGVCKTRYTLHKNLRRKFIHSVTLNLYYIYLSFNTSITIRAVILGNSLGRTVVRILRNPIPINRSDSRLMSHHWNSH